MTTASAAVKPPSVVKILSEARALFEFGAFNLLRMPMKTLAKGDGHPVLVLPGFMASDASTRPLRNLLRDLNYEPFAWGLGRNMRFNKEREAQLIELIHHVYDTMGEKMSIVGWSLGGVFAREMAKMHPDMVRMVITLGSPITNNRNHSGARHLFEAINGKKTTPEKEGRYRKLHEAPPVPTTSIFTKSDGIVNWRGSIQQPCHHDEIENIQVPASHIGLGVNPLVMVAIADRLKQDVENWQPFNYNGWRDYLFTEHQAEAA